MSWFSSGPSGAEKTDPAAPSPDNKATPVVPPSASKADVKITVEPAQPKNERKSSDTSDEGPSEFPHLTSTEISQTDRETIMRNMNRNRSEAQKAALLAVRPEPKPGLSGWSSNGFTESEVSDCLPGMEAVLPLERVFVDVAGKEFDTVFPEGEVTKNKYEIVSETKERLYFAAETLEESDSYPLKVREVDFTVMGPQGGLVFHLTGTTEKCTVRNEAGAFGSIRKVGFMANLCASGSGTVYAMYDEAGLELFRLVPSVGKGYKQVQYSIYPPGGPQGGRVKEIGAIKRNWEDRLGEPDQFGVKFPQTSSPTSKALLVAAMLLRYFRLEEPTSYGPNRRRFFHGFWYSFAVALLIVGLLLSVVLVALLVETQPDEAMKENPICKEMDSEK